jgi:hypothetical protein
MLPQETEVTEIKKKTEVAQRNITAQEPEINLKG